MAVKNDEVFPVEVLERRMEDLSTLSADFLALLTASTVIATLGLFENSAAVIIGAMIIAPLMRPLTGLSLGTVTADLVLLRRALLTIVAGTALGMLISFSLATLLQQIQMTPEMLARTKPTLLDLGVAFFAGAIGAYCQAKEKLSDSLAGVAIAVALVPPLSVVGAGLALHEPEVATGAALLYATNLVGITIAGALVFFLLGYAPLHQAKRGLLTSCSLLALLAVPLGFSMNEMLLENRLSAQISAILQEKTHTFRDVTLRSVEVTSNGRPVNVVATVMAHERTINPKQVRMVQDFLAKELAMPISFRLKIIPLTEVSSVEIIPEENMSNWLMPPVHEQTHGLMSELPASSVR